MSIQIVHTAPTYAGGDFLPPSDDGAQLGSNTQQWSDLRLASGGVISWDNTDVTLTHSANTVTVAGGTWATAALTATTITGSGILSIDDTTESTSTTTGSIHTDGGLGVAGDIYAGDDIFLTATGVLNWGAGDVTVTGGTNILTFAGATSAYRFNDGNTVIEPTFGLGVAGNNDHLNLFATGSSGEIAFYTAGIDFTVAGTGNGSKRAAITTDGLFKLVSSVDSVAVANEVGIARYEIGAGNTVLAISQETAVATEVDETKFSHKMQVRLNGSTYYLMLTDT